MYSKNKKIICYIGDRRFNFIIPDTSSINIKTINIFDNSVVMSIDDIVPIRVDIYPVDADNILPVFEVDNNTVADIKMGTIVPKNIGNCVITVKSPDGKKVIGSIPLEVTEPPSETVISNSETYNCKSNIPNGVPYEALIPKCCTNSLVACRAYGASHIGLSSIRLVKTMMDLGHSAGIAIKQLCYSDTRGDVRTVDVSSVQNEIGILSVINDLETHFFGSTVTTE